MACMEHHCLSTSCGWYAFDNTRHKSCPWCGYLVRSYFDEEADHHPIKETDNDEDE